MENLRNDNDVVVDPKTGQIAIVFSSRIAENLKSTCPWCWNPMDGSRCSTCRW